MLNPDSALRLVYCYFGSGIALGVYGPKDEIDIVLDGLYNYNGHDDDEIQYLSDNFGYVLTTKDQLLRGLANAFCVGKLQQLVHMEKSWRELVWPEAVEMARVAFENIEHEPFLTGASPAREYDLAPNL